MAKRNHQVSRIYAILSMLEGAPHGLTISEIHQRVLEKGLGGTDRTTRRDLEALEAAGFPLTSEKRNDNNANAWKLERHTKISQHLVLTARELFALFLAKKALTPLRDTPFFEDLNSAFQRIEEKLGTQAMNYFSELDEGLSFEPGPKWGMGVDSDLIETLRSACTERQALKLEYNSVNSKSNSQRVLGPHFMYFSKGALYLVAEDLPENKIKVFAVSRMKNAVMLDQEYKTEVLDPSKFFEHSFGVFHADRPVPIQIEFTPPVADYVRERSWHPSQRITVKDQGRILLKLEIGVTPELIQWILGFGHSAQVIEPRELIERVSKEAEKIVEVYKTTKKQRNAL